MLEITEKDIHLYILNKSLLKPDVIKEIERLKTTDEIFNSELEETKEFYKIYNQLEYQEKKYSFTLTPLYAAKEKKIMKFAAQQNTIMEDKLKYINTFSSAENLIMVRLFYNPIDKDYSLYVLCEEDVTKAEYAVIKLGNIDKDFIADKKGFLKIKKDLINEESNIRVNIPIAKFKDIPELFFLEKNSLRFISKNNDYEVHLVLSKQKEKIDCALEFINNEPSGDIYAVLIRDGDLKYPEKLDILENRFMITYSKPEVISIILLQKFM
jgi:hypothetical protein